MDSTIFAFIRRFSWRQQLFILSMTVFSFPFLYMSLELPKMIINDALSSDADHVVLGVRLDQFGYLMTLCAGFFVLVMINGAFKYFVNVFKGMVSERMLRRLRYMLYSHVLRFPLPHFRKVTQGELVQMINAEVEPLGGYMGEALAVPAFQGGTLLTILAFMFAQDPILGLAAIVLYPLQIYIIPKLQAKVNALGKRRVRQVRRLAERISETAVGVRDIRANDATQYERARFTTELGVIFNIRFEIYKKKFFIKFLNNFLAQLGPFFFFSVGGYLVIEGQITLGALVAVLGAHKDLSSPWKELLAHYQLLQDVRIKYDQVVNQFAPQGMRDEESQQGEPGTNVSFTGELKASGVTVIDDDDEARLQDVSFTLDLPQHIAITGPAGSGKEELAQVLANLIEPDRGRILINSHELRKLNEAVTGRRIAYVGNPTALMAGSIEDNLLYGLKHRPIRHVETGESAAERQKRLGEAAFSGNSDYDSEDDWIDYAAASIGDSPEERLKAVSDTLKIVNFDRDVYLMGLRSSIGLADHDDLSQRLLDARRNMQAKLSADKQLSRLVEHFDPDLYNMNATLAENLMFGTPIGDSFDIDRLAEHTYMQQILDQTGLTSELIGVGLKLANTMVELFADLPPDHEYFRQFSFIDAEELPFYRNLIQRADASQLDTLGAEDRQKLLALPFKLIPARHRLGLFDEPLRERILEARRAFRDNLPADMRGSIDFFDPTAYNIAASVQENILFGKVVYGQAQAETRIADQITATLEDLDLIERVMAVGLKSPVGNAGSRLSVVQRQKLGLARALIKRPEIFVLFDPLGPLDANEQRDVRERLLAVLRDRTVLWALQDASWAQHFDMVVALEGGRIVKVESVQET